MIQEAIKQLWRARARREAGKALDNMDSCPGEEWSALGAIQLSSIMSLMRIKGRQLAS